jgi:small ligand-binding sensory domain FIST
MRSASDSVTASVASLGHHEPGAALLFDCAGRRVLGHGQAQEVSAISKSFGQPLPLAGLYTDGEVARVRARRVITTTPL